jgi:hypothetical protein
VYRANTTVQILTRVIWSLVPSALINSASPDFRRLAVTSLSNRFGNSEPDEKLISSLVVIFKRVRAYARGGRDVQSLNLSLTEHRDLLESQRHRCAHCLYEFKSVDYYYAVEDDDIVSGVDEVMDGEIGLYRTFRSPQLDHIIPFILGGDGEENWQILCKSCNTGKSDHYGYLSGIHSGRSGRFTHLLELTAGKRYAAISEAHPLGRRNIVSGDGMYFRIFKIDECGLLNPENIVARYC